MLCMLMLSAMAIPAMAEGGTVINKYDYTLNESFDDFTTTATGVSVVEDDGNFILETKNASSGSGSRIFVEGESSKAISAANFETGFKVKLDNSVSKSYHLMIGGSNQNYPVFNSKFESGSNGTYSLTNHLHKDASNNNIVLINRSQLVTGEWNDIRLKFTENHDTNYVNVDVYLNGTFIYSDEYLFNNINNRNRDPYRFWFYPNDVNTEGIYFDDMYIAQYTTVTNFSQEAVNASVAVGQEVNLPSTVNVTADGVQETVNVLGKMLIQLLQEQKLYMV